MVLLMSTDRRRKCSGSSTERILWMESLRILRRSSLRCLGVLWNGLIRGVLNRKEEVEVGSSYTGNDGAGSSYAGNEGVDSS